MTKFTGPLKIGATGAPRPTGNDDLIVAGNVITDLTGAAPSDTISLDGIDNIIKSATINVTTAVASGAAVFLLGDTGDDNKFGTISVSAVGSYEVDLLAASVSAGTEIITEVSAPAQVDITGFVAKTVIEIINTG